MKVLFVASVLDVSMRFGCTGAWWQLMKAVHELGHGVLATPYFGREVASPWWHAFPNPCARMGATYDALKKLTPDVRKKSSGSGSKLRRGIEEVLLKKILRPSWERHLIKILKDEHPVDAVVILTVPLNHLGDVAARVRAETGVPIYFYDGDLPASLPENGGFASGFSIYQGANVSQYDGFLSNSTGAIERLVQLGVQSAEPIWWAADPGVYRPLAEQRSPSCDVLFYGIGAEFREDWIRSLIAEPSQRLPDLQFCVAGGGFEGTLGRAKSLGYQSTSQLSALLASSKIALNISRTTHAETYASATTRIFELAAMGCAIVTNPMLGLDEWFEDGSELIVAHDTQSACEAYQRIAGDDDFRFRLGRNARARVLAEHTYAHRAKQLVRFLQASRDG